jgi:hypothetical protein
VRPQRGVSGPELKKSFKSMLYLAECFARIIS